MTPTELIATNSSVDPKSGCWLWLPQTDQSRPQCRWNGRTVNASHVALLSVGVKIPRGLMALHRCNNPRCVNPAHLYVGTHSDNMRDRLDQAKRNGRPIKARKFNRFRFRGIRTEKQPKPKASTWDGKPVLTYQQGYEDGKAGAPPLTFNQRLRGRAAYERGFAEGRIFAPKP